MSAYISRTDVAIGCWDVTLVPEADMPTRLEANEVLSRPRSGTTCLI
jgi:hypothetical protein